MTTDMIAAPVQIVERGLSCSRSDVLAIEAFDFSSPTEIIDERSPKFCQ